jgi:adenosylcobinamide-phosphate synthase
MALHVGVAVAALALEAAVGYPPALLARIGHPVVWIGALIAGLDAGLNRDEDAPMRRRLAGVAALALIAATALIAGAAIEAVFASLSWRFLPLAVLASSLLAQRSLQDHVADVAAALERSLDDGRATVAKIVGRDPARLDEAGVARAAIESLAENFSDGVVAPALWLAFGGLPGALLYKAVSTADSMIGHKSPRFLAFGWAAARCDDLFNLIPARVSAALIALAAGAHLGRDAAQRAARTALRDAAKHASPNAGWPEAAMAGALDLRLGGPRAYDGHSVDGAWLGAGWTTAGAAEIRRALTLYRVAALWLWLALLGLCWIL